MKYIISTTSISSDKQPHPDAIAEFSSKYRDERSFKSLKEWESKFPQDFNQHIFEKGEYEDGSYMIVARNKIIWTIEIDDLCKFVAANGDIVLSPPKNDYEGFEHLFKIEI